MARVTWILSADLIELSQYELYLKFFKRQWAKTFFPSLEYSYSCRQSLMGLCKLPNIITRKTIFIRY